MTIELALPEQLSEIRRYDNHIPTERLAACIEAGQILVLHADSHIVGILRFSLFWQTIPFLDLLYLDEAFRGKGLGSQMMAHWEAQMLQQGYDYVMLSTQADETAHVFYEKLGYRSIGAFLPPEQEAQELMYGKRLD